MRNSSVTKHHARDRGKRTYTSSPVASTSRSPTPASTPSASLASANKRTKGKDRSVTPRRHQTDDDSISACLGNNVPDHLPADTPPKELFVGSTTANKMMGTEITVSSLVSVHLFPQIKFVCNPTVELMFCRDARSICGLFMSECSPPITITEQDWWEHARKWIGKQVSVLRNSKNTQMKWSFMGKH